MRKLILGVFLCLTMLAGGALAEGPEAQLSADRPFDLKTRLAVGLGIPFGGGIGGNFEATFGRYFAATIGLGSAEGYLGWSGGVRAYPMGHDRKVNPRLSAYYGTVAILDWGYGNLETDTGAAYGGGFDWKFQRDQGVEVEILYVDYDAPQGFVRTRGSDVKLTLGYGWYF